MTPDVAELEKARDRLNRAIHAAKALDWLVQYGPGRNDENCRVEIRQSHGSACAGAAEAAHFLNLAAKQQLDLISYVAISMTHEIIHAAHGDLPK